MNSVMRIKPCFIFVLVLFCACGERIEYFRQVSLVGGYRYVGRIPVPEAEAGRVNCYRIVSYKNRIERVEYLQAGKPALSELGFATKEYEYFEDKVLISCQNQFGLPILIDDQYTYERYHLNENGFCDRLEFLDRNFHSMNVDDLRYISMEPDDRGNVVQLRYFGDNGRSTKNGVYGKKLKYDENDQMIEGIFQDQSGKTMQDEDGVAAVRYYYDASGNQLRISYFDADDKPFEPYDGMATTRWKYDRYGNKFETIYYDRFDNIVNATQGIAINTYTVDKAGNLISRAYFDSLRNPAPFNGFVKINFFYNKDGYRTKSVFFKEKNDSVLQDHAVRFIYDNVGNLREERTYDAFMKPLERNGIAVQMFGFDGAHNMISFQTFDAEGYLVPFESGIAHIRWIYNTMGEKIETRYFNIDGDLKGGRQHEAINKFVYDECGQLIERSYYDSLEQPTNFDGAAVIKYNYDPSGNYTGETRLDKNGNAVEEPIVTSQL